MKKTDCCRKSLLITGGMGFLGNAVARCFKARGYKVVGIGHGDSSLSNVNHYDRWVQSDLTRGSLDALSERFDVIVHCAGKSSVAWSFEHPFEDFRSTVQGTAELLEHARMNNPHALIIYTSSAAVYGSSANGPLKVNDRTNPVSPYGVNKCLAETLLRNYAELFGQRCIAVRFFSIYGEGLRRQLLWDAAKKLMSGDSRAVFWGTGNEIRDWIHVDDAADLIADLANAPSDLYVVNGGSGIRVTNREIIDKLRMSLISSAEIYFNCETKMGDPDFYLADMTEADKIGWKPKIKLEDGLNKYAKWFKNIK